MTQINWALPAHTPRRCSTYAEKGSRLAGEIIARATADQTVAPAFRASVYGRAVRRLLDIIIRDAGTKALADALGTELATAVADVAAAASISPAEVLTDVARALGRR